MTISDAIRVQNEALEVHKGILRDIEHVQNDPAVFMFYVELAKAINKLASTNFDTIVSQQPRTESENHEENPHK